MIQLSLVRSCRITKISKNDQIFQAKGTMRTKGGDGNSIMFREKPLGAPGWIIENVRWSEWDFDQTKLCGSKCWHAFRVMLQYTVVLYKIGEFKHSGTKRHHQDLFE